MKNGSSHVLHTRNIEFRSALLLIMCCFCVCWYYVSRSLARFFLSSFAGLRRLSSESKRINWFSKGVHLHIPDGGDRPRWWWERKKQEKESRLTLSVEEFVYLQIEIPRQNRYVAVARAMQQNTPELNNTTCCSEEDVNSLSLSARCFLLLNKFVGAFWLALAYFLCVDSWRTTIEIVFVFLACMRSCSGFSLSFIFFDFIFSVHAHSSPYTLLTSLSHSPLLLQSACFFIFLAKCF